MSQANFIIPQSNKNTSPSDGDDSGSETSSCCSSQNTQHCTRCEEHVDPNGWHASQDRHCETCGDVVEAREQRNERRAEYGEAEEEYNEIKDDTPSNTKDLQDLKDAKTAVREAYYALIEAKGELKAAKQASDYHMDANDTDSLADEDPHYIYPDGVRKYY